VSIEVPQTGFIFWPVGTGDSTTVRLNELAHLQIDLRHMEKSEDSNDPAWPVIDELIEILPSLDGTPYLSAFALTHPDLDHCQGFEELLERVFVSELWMSPRTFREYKNDDGLCEDAKAFHDEAMRRVKKTIEAGGDPGRGDRIRIIGYDHWLKEIEFQGFPREYLSIPGEVISHLDGTDVREEFQAFVHAPFVDDSFGDRNDCSLAFQISLANSGGVGRAMLMGDLKYPIVKRIFQVSDTETLSWNVLLAPHHCSKSVMYWKDEGDENETLRKHIVNEIGDAALSPGYVVSSSMPIPTKNSPGDNPPHAKAKVQYLSITPNDLFCTHEHPNKTNPLPVVFEVNQKGFSYFGEETSSESLKRALAAAGAIAEAPKDATGFG